MKKRVLIGLIILTTLAAAFAVVRSQLPITSVPLRTTPRFLNPPPKDHQPAQLTETDLSVLEETPLIIPEPLRIRKLEGKRLQAPKGFRIQIFALGFKKPRMMAINQQGDLMITAAKEGRVYVLPDRDGDGVADEKIVFAAGMRFPHGIVVDGDSVLVAEEDKVQRLKDVDNDGRADQKEILISNLPTGGNHITRTIAIDAQRNIYVSIGSSCNVCRDDPRRAAILRFNPDGSNETLFAAGLRNAVGIVFHPQTGKLWATDNGRDWLGDELPPEEIDIVEFQQHYGWPFCYGDKVTDPDMGDEAFCQTTASPAVTMQAHSAPLGLRFINSKSFPNQLQGDLLVAFHGSWNRSVPTGYKIVRVKMENGKPVWVEDFITGWLNPDGTVWGRPVDVIEGKDGALYISDDNEGIIYRVTYEPPVS